MTHQTAIKMSPTQEILQLRDADVTTYMTTKRRNLELGGIVSTLNRELMFGDGAARDSARDALQKLGYVLY